MRRLAGLYEGRAGRSPEAARIVGAVRDAEVPLLLTNYAFKCQIYCSLLYSSVVPDWIRFGGYQIGNLV